MHWFAVLSHSLACFLLCVRCRQDALRQALLKLHAVVANVCAAPENAAFRRIPRDNANFQRDLGRFDGGHQSLFALGFQEQAESETDDVASVVFVLEVCVWLRVTPVSLVWFGAEPYNVWNRSPTCRWTWTLGAPGSTT